MNDDKVFVCYIKQFIRLEFENILKSKLLIKNRKSGYNQMTLFEDCK